MGDSAELKNTDIMSSDETDVVSSSSEAVVVAKSENGDLEAGQNHNEVPCSSSIETGVTESGLDSITADPGIINSPSELLVDENCDVEPDSTDGDVEVSCTGSTDEGAVPYDSIMDVCSTAAQQIKKTITEVLKSRESVSEQLLQPDDFCSSLEANLKEKIADFEKTVEQTNSPTKESNVSSVNVNSTSSEEVTDSVSSETAQAQAHCKKTSEPSDVASNDSVINSDSPNRDSDATSSVPVEKESSPVSENKQESNSEVLSVPDVPSDSEKSKKNQKSSAMKKKGEKSIDQILKSLSNCSSPDVKLLTLCRKHIEVLEELRTTEARQKQCERQAIVTLREKEQLQADHNRTILAKSRLESLCRELQRQNKAVKEESLLRIREEEEKRKDVANKFQMTLNDISTLMQDNSKKNLQLREENAELAKKLKSLVEHYEMWEKHMGKVLQQKDLEVQLAKAKLAKTNLQLKQDTEKYLREKKDLLENMSELQKKCTELASNEVQLRTELSVYTSKYEEFQSVLNKSNQVFASFKTDMDTTSKKIKKLEKETNTWKTKWENSNGALLEMIADKQKRDKELLNAQQRVLMLEKLCRALQAERNDLQSQIKKLSSNSDGTVSSGEEIAAPQ